MSDAEFYRVLQKRADSCTPEEFKELCVKYGGDDAAFDRLQKGVSDHGRREDSGDWTSPATPGWPSYRKKREILEQFTLDRGPRGAFSAAAAVSADAVRITALEKQVADLTQRLTRLERTQAIPQFNIKR